jgi:Cys-rich protein (TIGR01571 family)
MKHLHVHACRFAWNVLKVLFFGNLLNNMNLLLPKKKIVNTMLFLVCTGCIGLFCPCYLFGKNAEFLGSGTLIGSCATHFILWALVNTVCCCMTDGILLGLPGCFVACYACGYRRVLREKYNLQVLLVQNCNFIEKNLLSIFLNAVEVVCGC